MRFIDHRADRLGSRSLWGHKRRSRSRFLSCFIVRTWPGMVRKNQRRIFRMNAKRSRCGEHRMMTHAAQNLVGFCLIVVDAGAVPPTMRGEVERHHEIL